MFQKSGNKFALAKMSTKYSYGTRRKHMEKTMKEYKKLDTSLRPKRPNLFWYGLEKIIEGFYLAGTKTTIKRINCEGLKPPYLVIATHSSFVDFPMVNRCTKHRCTWVVSVEEFVGRNYVMRSIGGIYKHKFTNEPSVVRNVAYSIKKMNTTCTFFPEARFSLIGKTEPIDKALGKLAKLCKCPVVVIVMHGNFIRSPQWCKRPYRKVPLVAEMKQVATLEEVQILSAEEIQSRIEQAFVYNDYHWQLENKIKVDSPKRAHNIHRVLYQCPSCGEEFTTDSKDTKIWCKHCGKSWTMDEYGRLLADDGKDIYTDPTEWYDYQAANVKKEVEAGTYRFEDDVYVEKLVSFSGKGFVRFPEVAHLVHDENGFTVKGVHDGQSYTLHRDAISMSSVHIEYDFKGRGDAFDLFDGKDTYWIYPINKPNPLTKLHFAQIALYNKLSAEAENK